MNDQPPRPVSIASVLELAGWAPRPEWFERAACLGTGSTVEFFPPRGQIAHQALALCRTCDVVEPCLEFALDHSIQYGVWGSLTARGRRQVRQQRNRAARAAENAEGPGVQPREATPSGPKGGRNVGKRAPGSISCQGPEAVRS
jgi:WhiB family redox-sensing transcriptional regulator